MRDAVERGDSILRAAHGSGVFTPVVLQMIAVGEETGAVDELMDEVAQLYTNDVRYELKTLSQQLETDPDRVPGRAGVDSCTRRVSFPCGIWGAWRSSVDAVRPISPMFPVRFPANPNLKGVSP